MKQRIDRCQILDIQPQPTNALEPTTQRPSTTWTSSLANAWQQSRLRQWTRSGGAITTLALAMGIATACSSGGDGETGVIETTPTTTAPPSSIAAPLTLALSDQIAFVSRRDGDSEIYVMNTDGSDQANLTDNPAFDRVPTWSPDGAKIAFSSSRDGDDEIYRMNANGSGQIKLTNNQITDSSPAWSLK